MHRGKACAATSKNANLKAWNSYTMGVQKRPTIQRTWADVPVRSPGALFIYTIQKNVFRVKQLPNSQSTWADVRVRSPRKVFVYTIQDISVGSKHVRVHPKQRAWMLKNWHNVGEEPAGILCVSTTDTPQYKEPIESTKKRSFCGGFIMQRSTRPDTKMSGVPRRYHCTKGLLHHGVSVCKEMHFGAKQVQAYLKRKLESLWCWHQSFLFQN